MTMRGIKNITASLMLTALTACSSSSIATYDYQKNADFSKYHDCRLEPKAGDAVTGLVEGRIHTLLPALLRDRGLPVKEGSGLVVRVRLRDVERVASSPAMSPWRHSWPYDCDREVYSYQATEMLLQLIDVERREVVWQAYVPYLGKAGKDEEKLREILVKTLAGYPPGKTPGEESPR